MPKARTRTRATALLSAAFAASGVFAATPAHAVLDQCIAKVTLSSTATDATHARVTATVNGSCPTAVTNDEIVCLIELNGAPAPATRQVITRVLDGCSASVTIPDGLQGTPYVAVGTVESPAVTFPGGDASLIIP